MKLKIISDGTKAGTRVVNADNGEQVEDVSHIEWRIDGKDAVATASMSFELTAAEITVDEALITDSAASVGGIVPHGNGEIHIHHVGCLPVNYGFQQKSLAASIERLIRGRGASHSLAVKVTCPHCGHDTAFGEGPVKTYRCGGCERLVG